MKTATEIANSTETSIEIINAIAERVGNDEAAILAEWQEPSDMRGIIADAAQATEDDELSWGTEGVVWSRAAIPLTITTSDLDSVTVQDQPLVDISGQQHRGQDQDRWFDLSLYRHAARETETPFICHIEYFTERDTEEDHDLILRARDIDDLRQQLRDHGRRPFDYVRGFPPLPQYAERQANLHHWLRARFCALAKDLIITAREAGL